MDVVFAHLLQRCCDIVNENVASRSDKVNRKTVVIALDNLSVTNRELAALARGDARFAYVMFYHRWLLYRYPNQLLDYVPRSINVHSGRTHGFFVPEPKLKKMTTVEMFDAIESAQSSLETSLKLNADYRLSDVPASLPARIKIFVSQFRGLLKMLKRLKTKRAFFACSICGRSAYKYTRSATEKASGTHYETLCTDVAAETPLKFCSRACECAHIRTINAYVGVPQITVEMLDCERRIKTAPGRGRVAAALAAAQRRNADLRRGMAKLKEPPPEQADFVLLERQRRVQALNVDLGVVFASSILASSATMSAGKLLAGISPGWRRRSINFARATRGIVKLYKETHRDKTRVISNLAIEHPERGFLAKIRCRARKLM